MNYKLQEAVSLKPPFLADVPRHPLRQSQPSQHDQQVVHNAHPDKEIHFTECSGGDCQWFRYKWHGYFRRFLSFSNVNKGSGKPKKSCFKSFYVNKNFEIRLFTVNAAYMVPGDSKFNYSIERYIKMKFCRMYPIIFKGQSNNFTTRPL